MPDHVDDLGVLRVWNPATLHVCDAEAIVRVAGDVVGVDNVRSKGVDVFGWASRVTDSD